MSVSRVVVVTGAGGMGVSVVRRLGSGCRVVLADVSVGTLAAAASALRLDGFDVVEHVVDVSSTSSVSSLATFAASLGPVVTLVHTAGVSPATASVSAILAVDLLGVALVLDAFLPVMEPGGAAVFIASMAGSMAPPDAALDALLAVTPAASLLGLPELTALEDPGWAYLVAKRANQVRVRSSALAWGRRGLRVNSVSPGVISTPMGAAELASPNGEGMRAMIAASALGRVGTASDIAEAVAFLVGPGASFITGTDLLVDGGVVASLG